MFYETGTSNDEPDSDLLELWKAEWSRAGFNLKILALEDAKKHPYFGEMEAIVSPIFGNTHEAMNFYRYLAMASAGGGWISQGDTFPTNFPVSDGVNLPQDGLLTSYELHVPALLSGSAEEWTRVSRLIIDTIPKIDGRKSELRVLEALKDDGVDNNNMKFMDEFNVQIGFVYKSPHLVDCEKMGRGRAIHMANNYIERSFRKKLFPIKITGPGPARDYRAKAIKKFLGDWRKQCGGSNESAKVAIEGAVEPTEPDKI